MKHLLIMLIFVLAFVPFVVIATETDSLNSVISEYPTHTCSHPLNQPNLMYLMGSWM